MRLAHVPKAYWAALVVAALGFVVTIAWTQVGSLSEPGGVAACSFFDLGPILAAVGSLALVGVALLERRRQHVDARAPMPWVAVGIAVVAVVAIIHVLRGTGVLGGPC